MGNIRREGRVVNLRSFIARNRANPLLALGARSCRKYLRAYDNQFNWDIQTNGERFILGQIMRTMPGIVFDVGANVGSYAIMCAALDSVQEVHAFEISPTTAEILRRNCEHSRKIIINDFGLGEAAARVKIYHAAASADRTSLYGVDDGYEKTMLDAQLRTGDSYFDENSIAAVSFLKIDVEGHELATLKGFTRSLQLGKIAAIQFEHGEPSIEARTFLRDITGFLEAFGFHCFHLFPHGIGRIARNTYETEDFRGRNYIALSPDVNGRFSNLIQ
jgi:FkbM family methyltransferase